MRPRWLPALTRTTVKRKRHHEQQHHIAGVVMATSIVSVSTGVDAVTVARAQIGKPYVWAATGPNSFDCSGLVVYCFKRAYGMTLPHYSGALSVMGQAITREQLQPNDLIFHPGHVQIYSGNGMVIEAPTAGIPVREVPIWAAKTYRRLVAGPAVQGFGWPHLPDPKVIIAGAEAGLGAATGVVTAPNIIDPGSLNPLAQVDRYVQQFMSNGRHWAIRVVEVIIGILLIDAAFSNITGGTQIIESVAGMAVKTAKTAAVKGPK